MVLPVVADPSDNYILLRGERLPLLLDRQNRAQLRTRPTVASPARFILGNTSLQVDQRLPQAIWGSQTRGMGTDAYEETAGLESFRISGWDTRHPRMLTLPPPTTSLGSVGATLTTNVPWRHDQLTNTTALLWAQFAPISYLANGTTWTALGVEITGVARFGGYYCRKQYFELQYSTDGVTWTTGMLIHGRGLVVHDNKLYTYDALAQQVRFTTDPTLLDTGSNWGRSEKLALLPGESVHQLVEWRDERDGTKVYLVTTHRLVALDDRTGRLKTFFNYSHLFGDGDIIHPWFEPWLVDGNGYLSFYTTNEQMADYVRQFTGQVHQPVGPNRGGGIPADRRFSLARLVSGGHWLFGFCVGRPGTSNLGRVIALDPQGGWHTVYEATSAAADVVGGGYSNGVLRIALKSGAIVALPVPETTALPQHTTGRTYHTAGPVSHYYGTFDGGTPHIPIRALGFEVHTRRSAGTRTGLDPNTSLTLRYRLTDDDPWSTLATLTAADTFPARLPIIGGDGKVGVSIPAGTGIQVRLDGASTNPANSPVVTAVILYFLPQPHQRREWAATLDLRDDSPAFVGDRGDFYGRTAAELRALVRDLAGLGDDKTPAPVPFAYGGGTVGNGPDAAETSAATVQLVSTEDPLEGDGVFELRLEDVALAPSG